MKFQKDQEILLILSYGHDFEYNGKVVEFDSKAKTVKILVEKGESVLLTFTPTDTKDHYECEEDNLFYDIIPVKKKTPKKPMKIHTMVTIYQGVIDEVRTFKDEAAAQAVCVEELDEMFEDYDDYPEGGTFEEKYEFMSEAETDDTEVRLYETEVE